MRVLFCEFLEASEEELTGGDGNAADDGVVEGGGQGIVVEENRVVEGSHTLDVSSSILIAGPSCSTSSWSP